MVVAVGDAVGEVPLGVGESPLGRERGVQVGEGPSGLLVQALGDRDPQGLAQLACQARPALKAAQPSVLSASLSTSRTPSGSAISYARRARPMAASLSLASICWPARLA